LLEYFGDTLVTRSLGAAMSAFGRLSKLDVMIFEMQRQQATQAEDRRELECGAKLAKQKEDEARKEKQTAAANAAPVFKCAACAGTGAGDQEYTEQVLRMHFMHAHAPIQRYHIQPVEQDHMQRKKGTATEAEDTKFNRRQLLLQPLVMAKVADIDLAGSTGSADIDPAGATTASDIFSDRAAAPAGMISTGSLAYTRATDMISTGSLDQADCLHVPQVALAMRDGFDLQFYECKMCRDFYQRREVDDEKGAYKQYRFCQYDELVAHCEDSRHSKYDDIAEMLEDARKPQNARFEGLGQKNRRVLNSAPFNYPVQAPQTGVAKTDPKLHQDKVDNIQNMNTFRVNKMDVSVFTGAHKGLAALAASALQLVKMAIIDKHSVCTRERLSYRIWLL